MGDFFDSGFQKSKLCVFSRDFKWRTGASYNFWFMLQEKKRIVEELKSFQRVRGVLKTGSHTFGQTKFSPFLAKPYEFLGKQSKIGPYRCLQYKLPIFDEVPRNIALRRFEC